MHEVIEIGSSVKRLLQRIEREIAAKRVRHPPSHDLAGEDVRDERNANKAHPRRDVGQVRDPDLVRSLRGESCGRPGLRAAPSLRPRSSLSCTHGHERRPRVRSRASAARRCSGPRPLLRAATSARPSVRHRPRSLPSTRARSRREASRPRRSLRKRRRALLPSLLLVVDRRGDRQYAADRLDSYRSRWSSMNVTITSVGGRLRLCEIRGRRAQDRVGTTHLAIPSLEIVQLRPLIAA